MTDLTMAQFIALAQRGKFFRVDFVKRGDGSERTMLCRMGVVKGTKGGSIGYDPAKHHLLPVYDVRAPGFRMVNLEEPLSASIGGRKYIFDRHKGIFTERAQ